MLVIYLSYHPYKTRCSTDVRQPNVNLSGRSSSLISAESARIGAVVAETSWLITERLGLAKAERLASTREAYGALMETARSARAFYPLSSVYVANGLAKVWNFAQPPSPSSSLKHIRHLLPDLLSAFISRERAAVRNIFLRWCFWPRWRCSHHRQSWRGGRSS